MLLNVFVSTGTGFASAEMKGYIQCSKNVSGVLRNWFPYDEGTCILVVSSGLCGDSSYESDMKKGSPWMIYKLVGDLCLNISGKRQVKQNRFDRFQNIFVDILGVSFLNFHIRWIRRRTQQ